MSINILVTGANGFIGKRLCAALVARGYNVRRAIRSAPTDRHGMVVSVGEIGPETDWREALDHIEVVVHLAGRAHMLPDPARDPESEYLRVNAAGTRCLAQQAAASGVRRLVLMSSIKVNGEHTGAAPFTAADNPRPEDHYGTSKQQAERELHKVAAATGLETVVLRPPLVYGPGVKANFLKLIRLADKGLPLPLGSIRNKRSILYVDNLVDVVELCLASPAATGNTYLVDDGQAISTPDLIRMIAGALGRPARLAPVPAAVLRFLAGAAGRAAMMQKITDSLVLDSARIRQELCWQQRFSTSQGIEATVEWYKKYCQGD